MPAVTLYPADLDAFAVIDPVKANAMITDALALAAVHAPGIMSPDFAFADAARAVLRRVVLRWNEAGTGASVQQSAGPFAQTVDTRKDQRDAFWPSEIEQLQALCKGPELSGAFSLDTAPSTVSYRYVTGVGFDGAPGWYPFGEGAAGGYYDDTGGSAYSDNGGI